MAAGVVSFTERPIKHGVMDVIGTWESDGSQAAVGTTEKSYTGVIMSVRFLQGAAPVTPTTGYDSTVKDQYGCDLLRGLGADVDSTADQYIPGLAGYLAEVCGDRLRFAVAAAGVNKQGRIVVRIRE